MAMFAAHKRFGPQCGNAWADYLQWSGFHYLSELVSTDEMLCPSVVEQLTNEDWNYNVHADYKVYFFQDFEYLKGRIDYDPAKHNLLSIVERPDSPTIPPSGFEFCGHDILDSYDSVSVLTNCGGFPAIFAPSEVNRYGLIDDLNRAVEISEMIRKAEPDDDHCCDCRVWSLCRYIGEK